MAVVFRTCRRRLDELADVDDLLRLASIEGWHMSSLHDAVNSLVDGDLQVQQQLAASVQNPGSDLLWPFETASQVKAYVIHVGKAGGSSLQQRLRIRDTIPMLPCRMNSTSDKEQDTCFDDRNTKKKKTTVLKQRIYASFHMFSSRYTPEQKHWLRNNTNLLIFTVRDPIDRVVSAFNFHRHNYLHGRDRRPVNSRGRRKLGYQIYFQCFETVEDLAIALKPEKEAGDTSPFCRELARELVEGKVEPTVCPHLYWNYKYYANRNWKNKTKHVAVVRTESLWHDVARLEYLMGGDALKFLEPEKQVKDTHGSEGFQIKSGVSKDGALSLCCALRSEIQVYHDLIVAAVNLDGNEKLSTLQSLFSHCGIAQDMHNDKIFEWQWNDWSCDL